MHKVRGVYEREKGSGIWYIRWNDKDGRLRKERAGTRAAAKKLYTVRRGEALKGTPHKFRTRRITFADLAKAALEYSKIHKKSYEDDVERMAVLVEWFGDRPADSIRPEDIERKLHEARTRKKHPKPLAPATQNKYKALLSLAYRLGIKNKKLTMSNPAHDVEHRREKNVVTRVLKPAEEVKLKAAIKQPERWAIVQLAIHTGARSGELWKLKHIQVDRTAAQVELLDTKNGEDRTVPLNDDALAALAALKACDEGTGFVLPRQPYGGWFRIAVKKAGISEDLTFHCLRHTFGSRLHNAGKDILSIARLMGHKDIKMTMRYAHSDETHLKEVVAGIATTKTGPHTGSQPVPNGTVVTFASF